MTIEPVPPQAVDQQAKQTDALTKIEGHLRAIRSSVGFFTIVLVIYIIIRVLGAFIGF